MKIQMPKLRSLGVAFALAFVVTSSAFARQGHPTNKQDPTPPVSAPEIAMEAAGGLAVLLVGSFLLLQSRKRAQAR